RTAILTANVVMPAPHPVKTVRSSHRRITWFASMATIASLFIVTALTLPTANQPSDRDAGTRRDLAGINGISTLPTDVLAELNHFDELNDEQKYAATEKLRSAVRNSEFRAEKLAATDPESALAIINMTDGIVEHSKADPEVTLRLRKSLAKSR